MHEIRTVKFYKRLSILADEVTSHYTEHLEPAHGCWLSNIMVRFGIHCVIWSGNETMWSLF